MPPKTDQTVARLHREFVRNVVEKTGTPATRLATEIGVSPSTLTRLLNEPDNGKATLRATTIAKLERYSGLQAPTLELPEGARMAASVRADAVPFETREADSAISAAIKAIVGGRKGIEAWTIQTRALECAGYMPGDTILIDMTARSMAGDAVFAQDLRGGKAAMLLRIHEPPFLVAATLDPTLRKPLEVDDEWIIVKGVILPHRMRQRSN